MTEVKKGGMNDERDAGLAVQPARVQQLSSHYIKQVEL